jgi:tRNA threonylcarbamoyladenosine biosynthesis protein TsaB
VRIVAVDTTTRRGSVVLFEDGAMLAEVRMVAADSHSRWLLRGIELVVEGYGLGPKDVGGWVVATGPGSFTGLRVGLSTVQGLALAASRPCVGFSSLDALAALAEGAAPTVVALLDAQRDEVFAAVYRDRLPVGPPRVGAVESVLTGVLGPVAFVGDGALTHRLRIESLFPGAMFPRVEPYLAGALARLGMGRLRAGEGGRPEDLRPLYLREADIRKAVR